MTGRATLTIDPSSGHMKAPTDVSASSCQRRRWASSSVMRLMRAMGLRPRRGPQETQVTSSSSGARERSKVLAGASRSG